MTSFQGWEYVDLVLRAFPYPLVLYDLLTMSQRRNPKASRNIPEHVKRAVRARDGNKCRNCGVVTEFLHYDHIFPHDLGGPTTADNIQLLCPTCNTSKGNKITCQHCRHWMSPDKSHCSQCGARLGVTKYSHTVAGRLESIFHRVGRVVVIGGLGAILLLFLVGGFYIARYFKSSDSASDQAATVNTIVNESFNVTASQPVSFKVIIPAGAKNARIVGGFKVTSGTKVNVYVMNEGQMGQSSNSIANTASLTKREQTSSARLRQMLQSGTYFLLFSSADSASPVTVAAEFYSKYD